MSFLIVNKFDSFKYNNNIIIHSNAKISSDVNVNIIGTDNVIDIGDSVILRRLNINILGNNCKLIIKNNCSIRGAIHLRQNNSVIIIDSYTTSVSANIFSMEGSEINILVEIACYLVLCIYESLMSILFMILIVMSV